VITLLEVEQVPQFVYEMLADLPHLETNVLHVLINQSATDAQFLVAALRGLDLLDFRRQIDDWLNELNQRRFPPAHQLWILIFAIDKMDMPVDYPSELQTALQAIVSRPSLQSIRKLLISSIGSQSLISILATEPPDVVIEILKALRNSSVDWDWLSETLKLNTQLLNYLQGCTLSELGSFMSAARHVSLDLAVAFTHQIGGNQAILERIRASDPWIQELQIVTIENQVVAVARYLFISESVQGDARERSVSLAKHLLDTLPVIDKVDVQPRHPGGDTLEFDGYEYATSGLLRQNHYDDDTASWNQMRFQLTRSLIGTSETERLTIAADLFPQVATFLRDLAKAFVHDPTGTGRLWKDLSNRREQLSSQAKWLPPARVKFPIHNLNSRLHDGVSGLISDICDNIANRILIPEQRLALSTYVIETVLGKRIVEAHSQPWHLIGANQAPKALNNIAATLMDIHVVLIELAAEPQVQNALVNIARRGSIDGALTRAVKLAKTRASQMVQVHRTQVGKSLTSQTSYDVNVYWFDGNRPNGETSNFAVSVSVSKLTDWFTSLESLIPKVQSVRHVIEVPLLVPVLHGYTIPQYAVQVSDHVFPAIDLGCFTGMLPTPFEERLASEVKSALSALQVISGMSVLDDDDPDSQMQEVLEAALNDFNESVERITTLGQDGLVRGIVSELLKMVREVGDEWTGVKEAATYARGLFEQMRFFDDPKMHFGIDDVLLMLAIHWDVDSESAVSFLESINT